MSDNDAASALESSSPTNSTRVVQLAKIQEEARDLFIKKNQDYGDAFAKYGPTGVIVRIGDKISRFTSLTHNSLQLVEDEKLRDTLIDLHNYSAMAIMLLDEQKTPFPSQDIECKICTFMNLPGVTQCEICNSPLDSLGNTVDTPAANNSPSIASNAGDVDASNVGDINAADVILTEMKMD